MLKLMSASALLMVSGTMFAAELFGWGIQWKEYKQAELKKIDQTVVMTTQNPNSGMEGKIKIIPGRRYVASCEVRGCGKAKIGLCGINGWNFSRPLDLSDQWQTLSITYYERKLTNLQIMIVGGTNGASNCEVRAVAIKEAPLPSDWKDEEIAARKFNAADYPGIPGKLCDAPGQPERKAMFGKRWYCPVALPVPANSRDLFYYCHLYKDSAEPVDLRLLGDGQCLHAQKWAGAAKTWEWVCVGPIQAKAIYPRVSLNYQCAPEIGIWVDQIILSTRPSLSSAQLDSGE